MHHPHVRVIDVRQQRTRHPGGQGAHPEPLRSLLPGGHIRQGQPPPRPRRAAAFIRGSSSVPPRAGDSAAVPSRSSSVARKRRLRTLRVGHGTAAERRQVPDGVRGASGRAPSPARRSSGRCGCPAGRPRRPTSRRRPATPRCGPTRCPRSLSHRTTVDPAGSRGRQHLLDQVAWDAVGVVQVVEVVLRQRAPQQQPFDQGAAAAQQGREAAFLVHQDVVHVQGVDA